ncbi:hypothetical protein RHSIM_Rhsim03G0097300 [Rhododendron simsii]|uniref:MULE transposase domain-containing protein n=1 Tax=Rhododendron simsii TaxID=118357 RepID=A0A834H959_RHOSS|nr:hypothetical protein RHSIM_Rhsim03G0097300 [Rhododendron simsii]
MAMMAGESVVPANRGRGQLRLREALRHPAAGRRPHHHEPRDVIARAQSGTGKTSTIGITVCQIIDTQSRESGFVISATLPNKIWVMKRKFMTDPVRIVVKRAELTLEGIKLFFIAIEREEWKFDTLCDLYDTLTITQAVIFCNTKRKVKFRHILLFSLFSDILKFTDICRDPSLVLLALVDLLYSSYVVLQSFASNTFVAVLKYHNKSFEVLCMLFNCLSDLCQGPDLPEASGGSKLDADIVLKLIPQWSNNVEDWNLLVEPLIDKLFAEPSNAIIVTFLSYISEQFGRCCRCSPSPGSVAYKTAGGLKLLPLRVFNNLDSSLMYGVLRDQVGRIFLFVSVLESGQLKTASFTSHEAVLFSMNVMIIDVIYGIYVALVHGRLMTYDTFPYKGDLIPECSLDFLLTFLLFFGNPNTGYFDINDPGCVAGILLNRAFNNFEFYDVRKLAAELSGRIHPQGIWQCDFLSLNGILLSPTWEFGFLYLASVTWHSKLTVSSGIQIRGRDSIVHPAMLEIRNTIETILLWPSLDGDEENYLKGLYVGQLLTAIGVEPNDAVYPIAVVEKQNKDTWMWFFELMRIDLGITPSNEPEFTFINDRQKGRLPGLVETFPSTEHRHCCKHLLGNFMKIFKGLPVMNKENPDACKWLEAEPARKCGKHGHNRRTCTAASGAETNDGSAEVTVVLRAETYDGAGEVTGVGRGSNTGVGRAGRGSSYGLGRGGTAEWAELQTLDWAGLQALEKVKVVPNLSLKAQGFAEGGEALPC